MNRSLLSLSLASNQITDEGCKILAGVLQRFPLTHEEVVQRRKLLSQHGYTIRSPSVSILLRRFFYFYASISVLYHVNVKKVAFTQ